MTAARMSGPEVLEEVAWFLDANVHPLLIADTIGRKADSIYTLARRLGDRRVLDAFGKYQHRSMAKTAVAA